MKFSIGDKVKITDTGGIYSKYLKYLQHYSYVISDEVLSKFRYSYDPEEDEKDDEYVVDFASLHLDHDTMLYVITNHKHTFIVAEDCLELLETEEEEAEPKNGDRVKVIEHGKCYSSYEQFMLKHKEKISSTVFWRYRYNQSYDEFYKENRDYGFIVQFIANHESRASEGKLAVISNGVDTFLFHIDGLRKI